MDDGPGAARVHQGHVDDGRVVVARVLPERKRRKKMSKYIFPGFFRLGSISAKTRTGVLFPNRIKVRVSQETS